jgi:hypothetical protein
VGEPIQKIFRDGNGKSRGKRLPWGRNVARDLNPVIENQEYQMEWKSRRRL